jgi:hypothetical protein
MVELTNKELIALRHADVGLDVAFSMPFATDDLVAKGLLKLLGEVAVVTPEGRDALREHVDREI